MLTVRVHVSHMMNATVEEQIDISPKVGHSTKEIGLLDKGLHCQPFPTILL